MQRQNGKTWHIPCGTTTLVLGHRTCIMGILNVTPDSFSDGGRYSAVDPAVARALDMLSEGADIVDVGGESTRPGSVAVDASEEIRRVIPVIAGIRRAAPGAIISIDTYKAAVAEAAPGAIISIDTYKAAVAEAAIAAGANLINDVWGFLKDPDIAGVAARHRIPAVVMHNQQGTDYHDLIHDIIASLRRSIQAGTAAGLTPDLMMIDPGVGFGKTVEQNLNVLRDLAELQVLGRPILLGTSRKSTIGKVLGGLPVEERLEGTAATVAIGIANGAEIIRVHDVKYMKRVATMTDAIVRSGSGGFFPG